MEPYDIVSDIGGTNVRFAQVDGSKNISSIDQHPLMASSSFAEAFQTYCQGHGLVSPPQRLAVGAAGPVRNGQVQLTNAPWRLKRQDLAALSATGMAYLVNDLQAVARAVPVLGPEDVEVLRGDMRPNHALLIEAPALAINVGTGFGAASVRKVTVGGRDGWVIGATEAGHMRSAISVAGLSGHATVENFLSGDGLLRVAREMAGSEAKFESSKAVFEQARRAAGAGCGAPVFTGTRGGRQQPHFWRMRRGPASICLVASSMAGQRPN